MNLQDFKNAMAKQLYSQTIAEAHKHGICIDCKQEIKFTLQTELDKAEYRLSAMSNIPTKSGTYLLTHPADKHWRQIVKIDVETQIVYIIKDLDTFYMDWTGQTWYLRSFPDCVFTELSELGKVLYE